MALREHFETSGCWLFKRRGFLPLVLFIVLLYGLQGYRYLNGNHRSQAISELACFGLGLFGLLIRAYTVGHVGRASSGNRRALQAETLNTTGMYSVVRHPLYLGSYLMWISAALLTRNVWVVVVITLAFWLYYERIMFAEESFLRNSFGQAYDDWARRTPAFIPAILQWQAPREKLNTRQVLRRERSSFLGLVTTYALFDAYVDFGAHGGVPDAEWLVLFGLALTIYLAVEVDKRRQRRIRVAAERTA
jgi:protein-S-isoprenylcysteine O-methyltransferase Ste14